MKRRERTVTIGRQKVRQYEVQAHFRRFPVRPQPSWVVVDTRGAEPRVLESLGASRASDDWDANLGNPALFLRREIVRAFGQDGKRDPEIIFWKAF